MILWLRHDTTPPSAADLPVPAARSWHDRGRDGKRGNHYPYVHSSRSADGRVQLI